MSEVVRFGLLGLGAGAMYALMAQGLVLVYRATGVLNFAQGAIGLAGTYAYYELYVVNDVSFWASFIGGVATSALLGVLVQTLIMRRLRLASPIVRLVATLGVLVIIEAALLLRYGATALSVPSVLPDDLLRLTDGSRPLIVPMDRLWLVAIAAALTLVLTLVYRYTLFGLATSGVAENERVVASVGWSPSVIASVNWAVGSALAAAAGIFIVPISGLQVSRLTTLLLAGLSVALIAQFRSFPVAFGAGLAVGVAQSEIVRFTPDVTGLAEALPFVIIIVLLVVRGRALPVRGAILDRLPAIGSGQVRPIIFVLPILVGWFALSLDRAWAQALTTTLIFAILLLSITVITGYAGQLSLAQFAFAGIGAFICGRLDAAVGVPVPLAFVAGVVGAGAMGALFALPAVRTRGINLAIVTLGLSTAVSAMVFNDLGFTGGTDGTKVSPPEILGIDLRAIQNPTGYSVMVLLWATVVALVVANLRRGSAGRSLIAVRTNERAAAALGINVVGNKVYAFALSATIAGLAGILYAYQSTNVVYGTLFIGTLSISMVTFAVIGGIGYIGGAFIGAALAPGGLASRIGSQFFDDFGPYLPLIGGVILLANLLQAPDGLARPSVELVRRAAGGIGRMRFARGLRDARERSTRQAAPTSARAPVVPSTTIDVRGVSVRFGGVEAVRDATFRVQTGRVTGLIGPNGAGKSTLIDAVTGFAPVAAGDVLLDGRSRVGRPPHWWARSGVSRSFQSLELFEDLTLAENLLVASDPRSWHSFVAGLAYSPRANLPVAVQAAVHEFGLDGDLDRPVKDLPYGARRLAAIARAIATAPSVLLLDEPAAGLSDEETAELARVIRRFVDQQGVGVLVVEHDMRFVMDLCDEVIVLNFGEVICIGPPDVVRRDQTVIEAYLGGGDSGPDAEAHRRVRWCSTVAAACRYLALHLRTVVVKLYNSASAVKARHPMVPAHRGASHEPHL